jgi:glycosyltransferase involved in cell wall biosynthesis
MEIMRMKIWINSCHAALEYDHAKIFQTLGHEVSGLFDIGSKQRPKISGITDFNQPSIIHDKNKTSDLTPELIGNWDVIIVHQHGDFDERAKKLAMLNPRSAIVCVLFGQGNPSQHDRLARYSRDFKNIYVVPYALKEYIWHTRLGTPQDRLRMIRFGKPIDEFNPDAWLGDERVVFCPCNSIHLRGDSCNWGNVKMLMGCDHKLVLSGKDTEQVGGIGELSFDEYRMWLIRARCYLHVGTIPAPYTLTLIEAICSGTPVIAFDNGHGLALEELGITIVKHCGEAYNEINRIMNNDDHVKNRHEHSRYLRYTAFGSEIINKQWSDLLAQIQRDMGK